MLKATGGAATTQMIEAGAEFQSLLGSDWVQFDIRVAIPAVHVVLRRYDDKKLVEIIVENMASTTHKGLDYIDVSFSLRNFNI